MTDTHNSAAEALTAKLSPLAGLVMLVFFVAGLASVIWSVVSGKVEVQPPKELTNEQLFNGAFTHRIADELANVPFAEQAANLERAASWLAIGDTGTRVRRGCDGWLFLADENRIHHHAQANAAAKAQKVTAVRDWLAKRNIKLLVAVVPDKSRIASEQLCGLARSAQLAERVNDWQALLAAQNVPVLNLAEVMAPLGSDAFLRTDTHWSELGAAAATQAIAAGVSAQGISATPAQQLKREAGEAQLWHGDLVRLAGLDWLPVALRPTGEQLAASTFTVQEQASDELSLDDLFGDSQLPNIALIGTSFSRNSNFVRLLEQALGASIGNFAKDGGEFSGAAKAYFSGKEFSQSPPQLVIWEIPERDLQSPYVDDIALAD